MTVRGVIAIVHVVALIALIAVLVALALWAALKGRRAHYVAAKAVASATFIALALVAGAPESPYGRGVLAALTLAWVGDVLLGTGERRLFLFGLVAFAAAHAAYSAAFALRGVSVPGTAVGLVMLGVFGVLVARRLRPHVPEAMRVPVAVYVVVISVMMALALGTNAHRAAPAAVSGAMAFFVSDLAVARERFVTKDPREKLWGLPLYYAGQVLLALSVAVVA